MVEWLQESPLPSGQSWGPWVSPVGTIGLESGAPPPKVVGALGHNIEGKGVVGWVWEITSYRQVAKAVSYTHLTLPTIYSV